GFLEVLEGVVVTHDAQRASRADVDRLGRNVVLGLQTKLIHLDVCLGAALPLVDALGDDEDNEEHEREGDTADGRDLFGDQVDTGDRKQDHGDHTQPNRD